ncbi:MAG TPA: lytic transglycosylase domain-containing protein [Streptosporangiaceae bacterium]|nr:lytic transglycosylase domain-containing protein [Streptosporangiaceae bacterium]
MGNLLWRRLAVVAASVWLGSVAATGVGYASVARPATIGVPFGSAGLVPQPSTATRTTATTAEPRQLVVPDVLAVIQAGIPAADLPKIKKLSGVRAALSVSGGAIKINGKQVNVIGVEPSQFRSWGSPATAGKQSLWQALSRGQFITSAAAQRSLGLSQGSSYPVAAATQAQLAFGGSAGLSVPGVDAVVDRTVAARLGLVANLGVLINAPADNLATLVGQVRKITGSSSHVISLQPARIATTTTAGQLPVDTNVSSARPGSYLELYKASAARYCPGLSWTVLAAIGEVESGNGTNVGPSSAGALGPMQFLPSTWQLWGIDGFGDTGSPNIMNPYDAVPSAADYLCAEGAAKGGQSLYNAIFSYNHADWYVNEVLAIAREYAQTEG